MGIRPGDHTEILKPGRLNVVRLESKIDCKKDSQSTAAAGHVEDLSQMYHN